MCMGVGGSFMLDGWQNQGINPYYPGEQAWWSNSGSASSSGGIPQFNCTPGPCVGWNIPSWQAPAVVNNSEASKQWRNVPDISMYSGSHYVVHNYQWIFQGSLDSGSGTSISSPIMAGWTALANQNQASLGLGPIGFANPAFYYIATSPNYLYAFHDINSLYEGYAGYSDPTSGGCVSGPGYDLVTGLGSMNTPFMLDALALYTQCGTTVTPPTQTVALMPLQTSLIETFSGLYGYGGYGELNPVVIGLNGNSDPGTATYRGSAWTANVSFGQSVTAPYGVISIGQSFVMALWVLIVGPTDSYATVLMASSSMGSYNCFWLEVQAPPGNNTLGFGIGPGYPAGTLLTYTPPQSLYGSWMHIAAVYQSTGSIASLYVNGSLVATQSGAPNLAYWVGGAPMTVGGELFYYAYAVWGAVQCALWTVYAVDASIIANLYAAQVNGGCALPSGL